MHARVFTLLALLAPGPLAADPRFVDRSADLPEPQIYSGGWEHFVGGGVAALDCNADGYPDFYATGGAGPSRLFINQTRKPGDPVLFAADASMPQFADVTGAYPLDIDGDGILDLYLMRVGTNVALKGGADCHFTDMTSAWGLDDRAQWTTAFSATWERGRNWPTIAVGNYVDRNDPNGPFETCDKSWLVRPRDEGGGFAPATPLTPSFCPLSMLFSDWQRNGVTDLRVSNDRQYYVHNGYEQMFHLDPLREYSEADGWKHVSLWGMGIASRDIDGDGLPDVMMTSMGDQLLQYNRAGTLVNAPYALGTYAQRPFEGDDGRPSTGWHAEFGDIDNDGRPDLFIAKGNVDQMPSNAMKDPNNLLMQGADGHFVEKAHQAGVDSVARSRGAALVDLNRDGRLDILVVNRRAPLEIWENATANTGHWSEIDLRMGRGNTRAVGAWVEMRSATGEQDQEVTVGGGHASGHATGLHFGLGAADKAAIRVIWPDGVVSDWTEIQTNRRLVVMPDGKALSMSPDLPTR